MKTSVRVNMQCAAITNGCMNALTFAAPAEVRNVDIDNLDPEMPEDRFVMRTLEKNGWHLNYGRWVCQAHPESSQR